MLRHLRGSSHHYHAEEEDHKNLIDLVEIKHNMVDPDEYDKAGDEGGDRKRRKAQGAPRTAIGAPTAKKPGVPHPPMVPPAHLAHLAIGDSSSASSAGFVVQVQPSAEDMVAFPRSVLKTMLDCVDRCTKAANYAVQISQQARNAFEEERDRLQNVTNELRELCNRGSVLG